MDETVNLDVHAISELKGRGIPTTNDLFKYNYVANKAGVYGECCGHTHMLLL